MEAWVTAIRALATILTEDTGDTGDTGGITHTRTEDTIHMEGTTGLTRTVVDTIPITMAIGPGTTATKEAAP